MCLLQSGSVLLYGLNSAATLLTIPQEEATADLYSKLKSIKAAEQERKKAMDKLRKEIAFLEQQVANEPELRDTTDLDRRLVRVHSFVYLPRFHPRLLPLIRSVR